MYTAWPHSYSTELDDMDYLNLIGYLCVGHIWIYAWVKQDDLHFSYCLINNIYDWFIKVIDQILAGVHIKRREPPFFYYERGKLFS